eukprot:1158580-Pelagomonas_calceolata.AAC.9
MATEFKKQCLKGNSSITNSKREEASKETQQLEHQKHNLACPFERSILPSKAALHDSIEWQDKEPLRP